jgi:hypothetical protein
MAQVADLLVEGRMPEAVAQHLRADEIAPSQSRERVLACGLARVRVYWISF